MEWTVWTGIGALFGGLSVAFGAFGAHALKERLTPEMLAVFETGARYQMYHALALMALGLVAVKIDTVPVRIAGGGFVVGTILFSGSLYALALTEVKQWGMVTPLGGVAFLIGWFALAFAAFAR